MCSSIFAIRSLAGTKSFLTIQKGHAARDLCQQDFRAFESSLWNESH
jgi:hypothetical protein